MGATHRSNVNINKFIGGLHPPCKWVPKASPVIEFHEVTQHCGVQPILRGISLRVELVEEIASRIIVLHHGEILAFDTLDGLQGMTACRGSLGDVLERLIFPDTTRKAVQDQPGRCDPPLHAGRVVDLLRPVAGSGCA